MSRTLPQADFEAQVAVLCGQRRATVGAVLRAAATVIRERTARGETVALPGLGRFSLKARAARQGLNFRTGEPIAIPATTTLAFRPSAETP
jgi:DNA-binding protein HU-beta